MSEIPLSDTNELPGYLSEDLHEIGLVYGSYYGNYSTAVTSALDKMKECASNLKADGIIRVIEHVVPKSDWIVVVVRGMAVKTVDDSEKL